MATQRTNQVMIRFTDAEMRRVLRVAAREPRATFVRRIVLEHVERRERRERA